MKKTNTSLIPFISFGLILAILLIILPIYLLFFLDGSPDEYKKYDKGITIEVNNLSNQSLPDLTFSHNGNRDFVELGTIKSLGPGETGKITSSTKELKTNDVSVYLHYYIEDGEKKEDSILYFYTRQPTKAVAIINIYEVNSQGYLKYELSGYNGWSQFGPEERSEE
ncbi:hypothetical protein [Psychrobacillus sp. BL-248-WT-3]|uniref:hypothetical protein n=1 Tax=Psychrobacillus sp. BL-248-WT-3 TaxID=2725306 RepID=UPI00146DF261|nr:hypothetical protein [Psychrobacillus sp. BL-248-WT-3]NME06546.1 hypothetical protein [Psychrobacillus sp. BL-248-WT-3]